MTRCADENIPLLAFHGDVSIPEKWQAAVRLLQRWVSNPRPIIVLSYGDLDPKGIQIPRSARRDILTFVGQAMQEVLHWPFDDELQAKYLAFQDNFHFIRVGLNQGHIDQYQVPENPDRPGTYQWEGLDDAAAQELIGESDTYIDVASFDEVRDAEADVTRQFRSHLQGLAIE